MATETRNIWITLAYEGTRYRGWQRQAQGPTVQEIVEEKIGLMLGERVTLIASGRTDAGVHALGQVCHFHTLSRMETGELQKGLNSLLPDDILITSAGDGHEGFHARYNAKSKLYEYRILNRPEPDIFRRHLLWHMKEPLDIRAMAGCMSMLKGTLDFSSFQSSGSGNHNPVRTVLQAEIRDYKDEGLVVFRMRATGFLRHMVRNIVGTLVEVGRGKRDENDFAYILKSGDRRMAGVKAPPQGLFLVEVFY